MTIPWPLAISLGPLIALVVWRAGLLSGSAALAAAAIGSASALAGADWMALLLVFFVSSVALGRLGRARKRERSHDVLDATTARTASQVLANGAVFGIGALGAAVVPTDSAAHAHLQLSAIGALAAATGDTWATEIGLLSAQAPRSILSGALVAPGMSGGVTVAGLAASVAGAALLAWIARAFGWPVLLAGGVGGVLGSLMDSVLGATVQVRRRNPANGSLTERLHDDAGHVTEIASGIRWMNNDAVNALATCTGAISALVLGAALS